MAQPATPMTTTEKETTNYHRLETPRQLQELLGADLDRLSVLYFRAEWVDQCRKADPFFRSLPEKWKQPLYLEIEAESLPDVSDTFGVKSVPTFLILRGHKLLSSIVGDGLLCLETEVERFLRASRKSKSNGRYQVLSETNQKPQPPPPVQDPQCLKTAHSEETEEVLFERCRSLMKQSKVVLFMKGDPTAPQCGFSQQAVKILQDLNIDFTTFDILTDEKVRQGMKKLNSWPTFPQLFIKGELVGGLDILKEMIQKNGSTKSELEELLAD